MTQEGLRVEQPLAPMIKSLWRLWCALCLLSRHQFLVFHALASVIAYLKAHTNFGSAQNGVFAVSRIRERICFGCDVN